MELKLTDETVKQLQEIAEIKDISVNEVASKVLDLYSKNYLNMVKDARTAADNAIKRYDKSLKWFNNEYEKILYSGLSEEQKSREYASLMTEMEKVYNIPILKDLTWEKENKAVIAMYRKLSMSRKL